MKKWISVMSLLALLMGAGISYAGNGYGVGDGSGPVGGEEWGPGECTEDCPFCF